MIYDEDPFRRRPRKSTARHKSDGRGTSGWRKIRAMAFQARADGQNQAIGWLRKGCSSFWRWESDTNSTNLDGIWGMSVHIGMKHAMLPLESLPANDLGRFDR